MSVVNGRKIAVMIGAGNIGRGCVGAAFAASGYEVVFIDAHEALVREINEQGEYPVRVLLPGGDKPETVVRGVRAVSARDIAAAAIEVSRADICATAVGVRALPQIAPMLALGLEYRLIRDVPPLNIIVCENMLNAGETLRSLVSKALRESALEAADRNTGYPEAVIGRMTPLQTEAMKDGNSLRVCVEKYAFVPVNKRAFKGAVPRIEGMVPLDRFEYYVKRKLFLHNLGHAAVAYLGLLKGYTYVADAADDGDILFLAAGAMRQSAAALGCENSGDAPNLDRNINALLYRFANHALGDTCARVAADPARKLGKNDRLVGAMENCAAYGLPYGYIAAVCAAAALELEKSGGAQNLRELTGLSADSDDLALIKKLSETCASAIAEDAGDAVSALRKAAVKIEGDITIL